MNKKELKKQIAGKLNLSHLSLKQQEKIISGLADNALARFMNFLAKKLSVTEKKDFEKLVQENKRKKALEFLNSKINDLPAMADLSASEAVEDFKSRLQW